MRLDRLRVGAGVLAMARAGDPERLCGRVCASIFTNEVGSRAVVGHLWLGRTGELADDLLREDLAELDAPLVEGVDVPDDALGEDGVFVECDQLAEDLGGEALGE